MISPDSQTGPNIARTTIICGWTFTGLALLAVSLVLWSRRLKKMRLRVDDYLVIFALVISIALVCQTTWAIRDEGMDHHEAEIPRTKFGSVIKSLLVNETLWGLVNTFVRVIALLFIEKAFSQFNYARWIARLLLVASVLYGLVVLLEGFLICRPLAKDWEGNVDGTCGNQIVAYLVLEIFGLFIDFGILVVPMPVILALTGLKRRQKVSFSIVLSIGILVFIITGLRIQALRMVDAQDFTYSHGYLGLLSLLGATLGIIFCCVPCVLVIYTYWWKVQKPLPFYLMRAPRTRTIPTFWRHFTTRQETGPASTRNAREPSFHDRDRSLQSFDDNNGLLPASFGEPEVVLTSPSATLIL